MKSVKEDKDFDHGGPEADTRKWRCFSLLHDPAYRLKLWYTLCYLASFNAVGCVVGLLGPTFLDLQLISGTNVEQAARVFTSQSAGHMTGTLASGFLYDHINRHFLLAIAIFFCSASTILIPWCSTFILMIVAFAVRGVAMGLLDTGSNSGTVQIWGKDSGPYMQALHFSFAIGAMISPLLATPFLAEQVNIIRNRTDDLVVNISSDVLYDGYRFDKPAIYQINSTALDLDKEAGNILSESRIHFAYLIVGLWILSTSVPFIYRFCQDKQIRIQKKVSNAETPTTSLRLPLKICCLILLGVFFFLYAGSFDCFSGFLMTFAVKHLLWTKSAGLILTSAYWAAFAVSRGLAVIVAKLISPDKMIFANYTIMIGGAIGIMFGSAKSVTAMWICTLMVGFSMSSTFPAAFTWTERSLFRVTGKLSAFLILSASTGTMVLPVLLGYLFQEHSKLWYLYITLGSGVVCSCLFAVLVVLAKWKRPMTNLGEKYQVSLETELPEKSESLL